MSVQSCCMLQRHGEQTKIWQQNQRFGRQVPEKNPTQLVGTKSHQQRSLEAGRHQRHRPRGEEEALEMALPCTSHEEGPPSICSTDMGSTWKEGQRQTAGYLETDNWGRDGGSRKELEWNPVACPRPTWMEELCRRPTFHWGPRGLGEWVTMHDSKNFTSI